jgi:hypothetical protein
MKCARQGCNNEVPQSGRGRPRRFCSDACKTADYKRRRRSGELAPWASALTGSTGEAVLVDTKADSDIQVVAAVHETIMLRNTFERLGRDARVELGVRCQSMSDAISEALLTNFRGAIDE